MTTEKALLPLFPNWLGILFPVMFSSAIVLAYSVIRFDQESPALTPSFVLYMFGASLLVFLMCIAVAFGFIVYRAVYPNKFEPFSTPKPLFPSDKSE